MASINVQMGVTGVAQFKTAMNQAQQSVKTLDAQLKLNEKQYKASGDKETYMANKSKLLKAQMDAQKTAIKAAEQALKTMASQGVDKASSSYQKMEQQLAKSQSALLDMQSAMNSLGTTAESAATGADNLAGAVNSINSKVSLDQVMSGINSITSGLENAAKKAVQVGQTIWSEIMDRARWADDTATQAQMYGVELEKLLQMYALFGTGMDTTVDAILVGQSKIERNVSAGSKTVQEAMEALGLTMTQTVDTGFGKVTQSAMMDSTDLFWKAGKAIMGMKDAYKQEEYAQALFGKSWKDLVPLFENFEDRSAYEEALESMTTNSEEGVMNLAALNDKFTELQSNFTKLETEILSGLAPALTSAADVLSGLLEKLMEYLQKPEGKKMLEELGTAVSGLFEDLGKIDPDTVVEGFVGVFNSVKESLEWLNTNKEKLAGALGIIVAGWGAAKITGGALQVLQLINGIKTMTASSGAAAAGAAAGTSWGTAFASAVAKAAPWLVGAYVMLKPGVTGDNTIVSGEQQQAWDQYTAGMDETQKNELWNQIWGEEYYKQSVGKTEAEVAALWESMFATFLQNQQQQEKDQLQDSSDDHSRRKRNITGTGSIGVEPEVDTESLQEQLGSEGEPKFEAPVHPELDPSTLQDQIDGVKLSVNVIPKMWGDGSVWGSGGGAGGGGWTVTQRANGLPYVPFDGYPAILHKGERVMTARENASRSFSSNLYVESMYMTGETDAAGLAARIAAQNRRLMAGHGS